LPPCAAWLAGQAQMRAPRLSAGRVNSPKPALFCYGADLDLFRQVRAEEVIE